MLTKEADIQSARQDVEEISLAPGTSSYLVERFKQFASLQEEHVLLSKGIKTKLPSEQRKVYRERINDLRGEMTGLQRQAQATRLGYEPYIIPGNYYQAEFDRINTKNPVHRFILNDFNRRVIEVAPIPLISWAGVFLGIEHTKSLEVYNNGSVFSWGFLGIMGGLAYGAISSLGLETTKDDYNQANNLNLEFNAPVPSQVITKYQQARDSKLFERYIIASPDFELFKETPRSLFIEPVLVGYMPENVSKPIQFSRTADQNRGQRKDQPGASVNNGIGFLIAQWDLQKDRKAAGLNF